MHGMLTRSICV